MINWRSIQVPGSAVLWPVLIWLLVAAIPEVAGQESSADQSSKKEIRKSLRKQAGQFLYVGGGWANYQSRDEGTSPLLYSGWGGDWRFGYLFQREARLFQVEGKAALAPFMRTAQFPDEDKGRMFLQSYGMSLHGLYLFRDYESSKIQWHQGWNASFNMDFRTNSSFQNASLNYEMYYAAGWSTRLVKSFGWKNKDEVKVWFMKFRRRDRQLQLHFQLDLPVVTLMSRPGYISITDFSDGSSEFPDVNNIKLATWSKYFQLNTRTELYYDLHNHNRLMLAYYWNFFHYDQGFNKVQQAYHSVLFSFFLRLNKKVEE